MPSEHETRKQLIDPRLEADGWRVVSYARWLAGDRTAADAVEEHPTDSGPVAAAHPGCWREPSARMP